ncbi:hypothetical protein GCM10018952_74320 [Streptosporangium vulgare]
MAVIGTIETSRRLHERQADSPPDNVDKIDLHSEDVADLHLITCEFCARHETLEAVVSVSTRTKTPIGAIW